MSPFRCLLAASLALVFCLPNAFSEEKKAPAPRPLTIVVGQTLRLQLSTKKEIETARVDNERVLRVGPAGGDLTSVLVTALAPGRARVVLIGKDGKKEICQLGRAAR